MTDELAGQRVGPMPVKDFMKAFLKVPAGVLAQALKLEPDYFDKLVVEGQETDMYDQFIEVLKSSSALPGFKLVNTSFKANYNGRSDVKNRPAISSYRKDGRDCKPLRSTGTWQFMSVELLMIPDKDISLHHDLESFFWVVLHHILRYMSHNQIRTVRSIIAYIFEDGLYGKTGRSPGLSKSTTFGPTRGALETTFSIYANKPLTIFTMTMLDHLEQWHCRVDANEAEIEDEQELHDISREAVKRYPFDDRNLAMRNHDEIMSAFESALKMKAWPISDKARDLFSNEDED